MGCYVLWSVANRNMCGATAFNQPRAAPSGLNPDFEPWMASTGSTLPSKLKPQEDTDTTSSEDSPQKDDLLVTVLNCSTMFFSTWETYIFSQSTLAKAQNPLLEYSGSGPKPPPKVLWLRPKTSSQSTLVQAPNPLPEYSGSGPNNPPIVLWVRPKTPSQSTLAEAQNPLPEYSG